MRAVDLEHAFAKAQAQLVSLAEGGRLQSPMPTLMLPHSGALMIVDCRLWLCQHTLAAPKTGGSSASGAMSIHRQALVVTGSPLVQTSFAATTHIAATPPLSVDDTVVVDNTTGAYRTPPAGTCKRKGEGCANTGVTVEGGQECWLTGEGSALQVCTTASTASTLSSVTGQEHDQPAVPGGWGRWVQRFEQCVSQLPASAVLKQRCRSPGLNRDRSPVAHSEASPVTRRLSVTDLCPSWQLQL